MSVALLPHSFLIVMHHASKCVAGRMTRWAECLSEIKSVNSRSESPRVKSWQSHWGKKHVLVKSDSNCCPIWSDVKNTTDGRTDGRTDAALTYICARAARIYIIFLNGTQSGQIKGRVRVCRSIMSLWAPRDTSVVSRIHRVSHCSCRWSTNRTHQTPRTSPETWSWNVLLRWA